MPTSFSHSRLASFENCPRQYRYRYIDRLQRPGPGIEAYVGITVHRALEFLYREIQAGRPAPACSAVLARFEEAWGEVPVGELRIVRQGFDSEDYHALGRHCLETYYAQARPFGRGQVLDIEKKVSFTLHARRQAGSHSPQETSGGSASEPAREYRLVGYIDRLMQASDGVVEIHDYKTSGSFPRRQDLDEDRQLSLYEIGIRKELGLEPQVPVRQVWHYLTFQRREVRERQQVDLIAVARRTVAAIQRVESAQTFPARTGILCHWCDFREHCPEGRSWVAEQPRPGLPAPAR